jgi:hypothetical protein
MKDHLEDVEFAAALVGEKLAGKVAEHLEACVSCRRQLAGMRCWIEERRDRTERDAPDWQDQWERIAARLDGVAASRPHRRWLRPAVAAAAVVAVAVGVGIMQLPEGEDVRSELAVEEILAETDALLADDTIPGFEVIDPGLEGLQDDSDNGVS